MPNQRVAIIGAGVTGVTTAWYLCRDNYSVTLIDQHPTPAMECSLANGGQLSICNSETWLTYQHIILALKSLFHRNSILSTHIDWNQIKWLFEFFLNTLKKKHLPNTRKLIELGIESRLSLQQLLAEEEISCDYQASGILNIYTEQKRFNKSIKRNEYFNQYGWNKQLVNIEQIQELEPTLNVQDLIGGFYAKDDGQADIHKFTHNLSKKCVEKYHMETLFENRLTHLEPTPKKSWKLTLQSGNQKTHHIFDKVIIASGANASLILKNHMKDTIYPVKGYSITLQLEPSNALPQIPLVDDQAKIVSSRLGDKLRVAGFAELRGWDHSVDQQRINQLIQWSKKRYPNVPFELVDMWSCFRPMSSSMLPIIKQVEKNLYVNSGGGHLGWTTAMASASKLHACLAP